MDILKLIFVIFLGVFSLGEVIRFDLNNNFSIKPIDIAAVVLVLFWLAGVRVSKKNISFKDNLLLPLILFIACLFISLLFNIKNFENNEIFLAFAYILRWILYSFLFFIVRSFSPKFKKKILYLMLVTGGLLVLFGFVQYFFYSSLRNLYYSGWDEHMHRVFSTFLDPNFAGAFFVLYSIFLSGIFLYFLKKNNVKQTWLIGLISVFSITSIFLTYSRSALITLFTSIIIFSTLTKKIYLIFGVVIISIIFILISSKNFNIENINLFRIASTEARIDSAKIAIQIIRDNPFLGIGFNTYRYAQIKYGFRNAVSSHADAGTDNSFLFVFATTGIIGLILYLNLLLAILKKSYMNYKKYKDKDIQKYISVIVIASMAGIIVDSLFINSLFYSLILVWMWILLGLNEE